MELVWNLLCVLPTYNWVFDWFPLYSKFRWERQQWWEYMLSIRYTMVLDFVLSTYMHTLFLKLKLIRRKDIFLLKVFFKFWDIIDIQWYKSLRYTEKWFIYMHHAMITTITLVNLLHLLFKGYRISVLEIENVLDIFSWQCEYN